MIQECLDGCSAGRVHVLVVAGQTKEGAVTQHRLIENVGDGGWQMLQEEESVNSLTAQLRWSGHSRRGKGLKKLIQTVLLNNASFTKIYKT